MFFSNDRNIIEEIMEHLLNENKNLCCAMQKFKKSIKDIVNYIVFKSTDYCTKCSKVKI